MSGDFVMVFSKESLNYNSAHGQAVAIGITYFDPIKSFSILPQVNIHSVVRSADGVELGKNPVAICIVHSNRPRQYVVANAVVPNLELTACRVRINEAPAACRIKYCYLVRSIGATIYVGYPQAVYTQCVNVYIQYSGCSTRYGSAVA